MFQSLSLRLLGGGLDCQCVEEDCRASLYSSLMSSVSCLPGAVASGPLGLRLKPITVGPHVP